MNQSIVDAHQHFWDPLAAAYPWMTAAFDPIRRRFGPDDLHRELLTSDVHGSVLVQTRSSVLETFEFLKTARRTNFILGVVGWVDLTGDTAEQLHDIRSSEEGHLLVGIRHQVHEEQDPDWLLRPDVGRGLKAVEDAGLAYDLLIRSRELPAAIEIARRHPGLRLVVDHIAKPNIAAGETEPWWSGVKAIASFENVVCKLSGITTEAAWDTWTEAQLRPYVERIFECFSPNRVMFGSDWPVCLLAGTYAETVATTRELITFLSPDEREAVLSRTALAFYRLHESAVGDHSGGLG